ncbi:hypothetical protein GETHLI_33570 [Geothrix limicola]|uniref:DUF302 domain-containing protein n=1 Tax=Geothrix limicola TaxID=2927978 RepID=A0ABQ5QLA6_9BACT|nr:DUF302 domain-containing protein [Geothrix limicola]GLH74855.1 hypothetical protein GETHLI_33570 [Geothrix limicola]
MNGINVKREIQASLDEAIDRTTTALGSEGFGILTRVDMHAKIKEKLGKDMIPTVILGACNPQFAFQGYSLNSDISALIPCNAVVREIAPGRISVEIVKPSAMVQILGDSRLVELAREGDAAIERALHKV